MGGQPENAFIGSLIVGIVVFIAAYFLSGWYWPPEEYYFGDYIELAMSATLAVLMRRAYIQYT